ncbi:MAG: hypothetical protein HYV35_07700 [Lentisphaerae bacterium]|nr:hypothetical protein [Lentisphaerota bacterium]
MTDQLLVGAAEVNITPPVGTALAGSLAPRPSRGVEDPLTMKAIVLEAADVTLAYILIDVCMLERKYGDAAVMLAARRTGIPAGHIVWAANHTHTGPYIVKYLGAKINRKWLATLPGKFAEVVARAQQARRPARMTRERGYCWNVLHNRRLKFKGGREINTWLLHNGEEALQCLGAAAPIDPEVGILCFDDERGAPIAILWNYALHTNANFGPCFSADYPAVVANRLRQQFGPQVVSIFMPGACGDINPAVANAAPGQVHRQIGEALAKVIIQRLANRVPFKGRIRLGAIKKEIVVPYRDFSIPQEKRIRDSQWSPEAQNFFRKELEIMKRENVTQAKTIIQAWRIGEVGFASLPGELFAEWGLKIKAESPFPWTFPVELGGDYLGYLVTPQAWASGGYESLISRVAKPSVQGVARMVATAQRLLVRLWN